MDLVTLGIGRDFNTSWLGGKGVYLEYVLVVDDPRSSLQGRQILWSQLGGLRAACKSGG